MLAILYFCLYMLVCTYIMLQLLIGIVVDSIEQAEHMDTMAITQVIITHTQKQSLLHPAPCCHMSLWTAQSCATDTQKTRCDASEVQIVCQVKAMRTVCRGVLLCSEVPFCSTSLAEQNLSIS